MPFPAVDKLPGILECNSAVIRRNRTRPVLLNEFADTRGDFIERFLAGDVFELSVAVLDFTGRHPLWLVHLFDQLSALNTGITAIHLVVGIGFNRENFSIRDLSQHGAIGMAIAAEGFVSRCGHF